MKGEATIDARNYLITILRDNICDLQFQEEFISKDGVYVLTTYCKDLKNELTKAS